MSTWCLFRQIEKSLPIACTARIYAHSLTLWASSQSNMRIRINIYIILFRNVGKHRLMKLNWKKSVDATVQLVQVYINECVTAWHTHTHKQICAMGCTLFRLTNQMFTLSNTRWRPLIHLSEFNAIKSFIWRERECMRWTKWMRLAEFAQHFFFFIILLYELIVFCVSSHNR